MIDRILITVMALAFIFTTHLVSFEMGKKKQCNSDKDYRYSIDLGVCLKVGAHNIKGESK
jgi:uncharacterized UBP type Zn finger protein